MRDSLIDLVRMTKDLFEIVSIIGTDEAILAQAVDRERMLFLKASLPSGDRQLHGTFGLSNLEMLNGLFNFATYKADNAGFSVRREVKPNAGVPVETVTALMFHDEQGRGAIYKTMDANIVAKQAQINPIEWTLSCQPSKAKIAEFTNLSRMLSNVDKVFQASVEGTSLIFSIGSSNSATHSADMVFDSAVSGTLLPKPGCAMRFDIGQFLALMRISGLQPSTLHFSPGGVLGVNLQTAAGEYKYFLKAKY